MSNDNYADTAPETPFKPDETLQRLVEGFIGTPAGRQKMCIALIQPTIERCTFYHQRNLPLVSEDRIMWVVDRIMTHMEPSEYAGPLPWSLSPLYTPPNAGLVDLDLTPHHLFMVLRSFCTPRIPEVFIEELAGIDLESAAKHLTATSYLDVLQKCEAAIQRGQQRSLDNDPVCNGFLDRYDHILNQLAAHELAEQGDSMLRLRRQRIHMSNLRVISENVWALRAEQAQGLVYTNTPDVVAGLWFAWVRGFHNRSRDRWRRFRPSFSDPLLVAFHLFDRNGPTHAHAYQIALVQLSVLVCAQTVHRPHMLGYVLAAKYNTLGRASQTCYAFAGRFYGLFLFWHSCPFNTPPTAVVDDQLWVSTNRSRPRGTLMSPNTCNIDNLRLNH